MSKEQALQVILNQIPATGEVGHETVDNSLMSTKEGREARSFFNKLRRDGAFGYRIDRETGELMLSRQSAATPVAPSVPVVSSGQVG